MKYFEGYLQFCMLRLTHYLILYVVSSVFCWLLVADTDRTCGSLSILRPWFRLLTVIQLSTSVWLGRSLWEHSLARRRCVNSWFAIASVNLQPTCACLCIIASMICKGNRLDSQHSSGCEGRRSRFCLYSTSLPPCDAMNWTAASYGLLRSSDSWQVGSYMDFSHDCVPLFVVFSLESLSRERESDQISMGKKDRVW